MRRLFLLPIAVTTFAAPALAQEAPFYYCSVRAEAPYGEMTAYQYVSRAGVAGTRMTMWNATLAPNGVTIMAAWSGGRPARNVDNGFVSVGFAPVDRTIAYRIELWRAEADARTELRFGGAPKQPEGDHDVFWFTNWSTLTALALGAPDFRAVVLRPNDEVVRRDRIDPAVLPRILTLATALQPRLDGLLARYRQRCEPSPDDGLPDRVPG
jgi:hypothetical protein